MTPENLKELEKINEVLISLNTGLDKINQEEAEQYALAELLDMELAGKVLEISDFIDDTLNLIVSAQERIQNAINISKSLTL